MTSDFWPLDPIAHRAALAGRALDALTQAALPGIEIAIVDGPPAWKQLAAASSRRSIVRTDADGWYRYLDLPVGAYKLAATPPSTRYAAGSATVAVVATGAALADLSLAPTSITGIVTAGDTAKPLPMARIRIDSGEITYTGSDGSYRLSPLEPGTNRVIEIRATRYVASTKQVTLQLGKPSTLSVTLALS